ncbi:hypothetical protein FQN57_005046 [Myotisia sp. PD_48]|nr:hypothetical protein FQN57_005046 [Myotisia sp. PD_48]
MGSLDHPLPDANSPQLALVVPTQAEKIETIRINGQGWKGPLTIDQYLGREFHLLKEDMVKDGGLSYWILVDRNLPPDGRPILSACESIAKRAFLAHNGNVEDVISHAVGSVFCRPEHRGRGYASRMLAELARILETWKQEKTARKKTMFSVLYSDVGKKFYASYGFKPFPASHYSLPPIPPAQQARSASGRSSNMQVVQDMSREDVRRYMCSDAMVDQYRQKLKEMSKSSDKALIAYPPDFAHMSWHWARDEYYSQCVAPEKGEVKVKGASVPSRRVFMTWNKKYGDTPAGNTLYILKTLYDEPSSPEEKQAVIEALAAIIRRAQVDAYEWNMTKVDMWNPTPLIGEAVKLLDPAIQIVHREHEGIPALKWDGASEGLGDEVEWVWNERFGWC